MIRLFQTSKDVHDQPEDTVIRLPLGHELITHFRHILRRYLTRIPPATPRSRPNSLVNSDTILSASPSL